MTKEEKLLRAIGEIDDELIAAADAPAPKKQKIVLLPKRWKKTAVMAAGFLFCLGVWLSTEAFLPMGSNAQASEKKPMASQSTAAAPTAEEAILEVDDGIPAESPAAKAEYEVAPESAGAVKCPPSTKEDFYMNYNLPLLPLDISGDSEGITAERNLQLDASSYYGEGEKVLISDSYSLLNATNEDKTVTVEYHFGNTLWDLGNVNMLVEGSDSAQNLNVNSTYHQFSDEGMNLDNPYNWSSFVKSFTEELKAVDKELLRYADEPVTVYEVYDVTIPESAPSSVCVGMEFTCDEDTFIWNNNFNGMCINGEERIYDFFARELERHPGMNRSLWVFGGRELADVSLKGYTNGACEDEVSGVHAKVRSYKTTLKEAVSQSLQQFIKYNGVDLSRIDAETLADAVLEYLEYSPLGSQPQPRYEHLTSWELYSDVLSASRTFTLEQTVTIPANGSVEVQIQSEEQANRNYLSSQISLDVATTLASDLNIESTTVDFIKPKSGVIIGGNLTEGSSEVDMDVERWYVVCELSDLCGYPIKD